MGVTFFKAVDGNGTERAIAVPYYGEHIPIRSIDFPNALYANVLAAIERYTNFDQTMTYFVPSQTNKAWMLSLGFTDVLTFDEIGNRLTFSNNNYVAFNQSTGTMLIYINGTQQGSLTVAEASTLFAYYKCTTDRDSVPKYRYSYVRSGGLSASGFFSGTSYYFAAYASTEIIDSFWTGIEPFNPPTDPFSPGGTSDEQPQGGTGDFDGTSDPIDFPSLPSISAVDAGFITLFNPSVSQLKSLASYMWSNSLFDLDTWKKIFADPMDAILGLTIVPVDVPSGGSGPVTVGNIPTDINMTYASSQYVEVDCGTLNVNEYWGAYLDYEPFTKAEIYLPYIGTHAISVDDIMGKEVHVKYHIDILSGACAAYVKCGDSVLYTFIGQCASSIPISGSDMTNVINGVISAAVSIGSMVATGGASAPLAAPALANTAVNHMKPSIEKSGSMSGTGGLLAIQTPYLILTRPRQCLPASQNEYMGYPAFISRILGDVSGYTEVEQVHLDGIAATEAEISEIENLLKSGVIL